jgi:polyisoprenoid-binding protein YceI
LDSGQAQRDAHLRSSDFLDVDTYPEMLFKSTRVEVAGPGLWCVVGELTICAVTRPFSLNLNLIGSATGPDGRALVGFRGTGSLSRTEFGLRWNKVLETGGVLVGDEVDLCLDVTLTKTQPSVTVAPSTPAGSRGRSRWWRRAHVSQA